MKAEEVTVFVTTIGDEVNFTECMSRLARQSVKCAVEVIDHVAPMSEAFQEMHRRCRSRYYIQVDEDMLLFPSAVKKLWQTIARAAPEVAIVCAPLWDCDVERSIYGVKIYRSEIVRRFPYRNVLSCEKEQLLRLREEGFSIGLLPLGGRSSCFGEHGKYYTPDTIFRRWQRLFQKQAVYGTLSWIEPWPPLLLRRYLHTKSELHLFALLGAIAGIVGSPSSDTELDWRSNNMELARLKRYFASAK